MLSVGILSKMPSRRTSSIELILRETSASMLFEQNIDSEALLAVPGKYAVKDDGHRTNKSLGINGQGRYDC